MKKKEKAKQLLEQMRSGKRVEIWEAAKALLVLREKTAVPLLMRILKGDPRAEVRSAAAYVLGLGKHSVARETLQRIVKNRKERCSVRGHAAEALGYLGDKRSIRALLSGLSDAETEVRFWSIFALGEVGDSHVIEALEQIVKAPTADAWEGRSLKSEASEALAEIRRRVKNRRTARGS